MPKLKHLTIWVILVAVLTITGGHSFVDALTQAGGGEPPSLGTANSFAVLAGSTATNTGATIVTGDLGVWPGTTVTGFPPGIVIGTIYAGNAVAQQAQSDVTVAYNDLASRACDVDLTGTDLGGLTLGPAVYCFATSAQLTGQLILDAQGNPDALFIFQIGSTLTTASDSSVLVINSGNECNLFWQVGSSATLGTSTAFMGNILALASITLNTSANVSGRTLARNEAVTMDTNNISIANCAPVPTETPDPTITSTATATGTPDPTMTSTPMPTPTDPPTSVDISNFGSGGGPGVDRGPWLLIVLSFLVIAWWKGRAFFAQARIKNGSDGH